MDPIAIDEALSLAISVGSEAKGAQPFPKGFHFDPTALRQRLVEFLDSLNDCAEYRKLVPAILALKAKSGNTQPVVLDHIVFTCWLEAALHVTEAIASQLRALLSNDGPEFTQNTWTRAAFTISRFTQHEFEVVTAEIA